jgi:hypothetical protein
MGDLLRLLSDIMQSSFLYKPEDFVIYTEIPIDSPILPKLFPPSVDTTHGTDVHLS